MKDIIIILALFVIAAPAYSCISFASKSKFEDTIPRSKAKADYSLASTTYQFIHGARNKKKARFYFDSKKVSSGIPIKANSEVMGFTFSIPIGK